MKLLLIFSALFFAQGHSAYEGGTFSCTKDMTSPTSATLVVAVGPNGPLQADLASPRHSLRVPVHLDSAGKPVRYSNLQAYGVRGENLLAFKEVLGSNSDLSAREIAVESTLLLESSTTRRGKIFESIPGSWSVPWNCQELK